MVRCIVRVFEMLSQQRACIFNLNYIFFFFCFTCLLLNICTDLNFIANFTVREEKYIARILNAKINNIGTRYGINMLYMFKLY